MPLLVQNPAVDQPEDSRLLSLLANVLEAMVDATEQREHARLHARLQVSPCLLPCPCTACMGILCMQQLGTPAQGLALMTGACGFFKQTAAGTCFVCNDSQEWLWCCRSAVRLCCCRALRPARAARALPVGYLPALLIGLPQPYYFSSTSTLSLCFLPSGS